MQITTLSGPAEFKTNDSLAEQAFLGQRSYRNHCAYVGWLHTKRNHELPSLAFLQSTHCTDTALATPVYLSSGLRATGRTRQLYLPFGAAQGLRSAVKRARVEEVADAREEAPSTRDASCSTDAPPAKRQREVGTQTSMRASDIESLEERLHVYNETIVCMDNCLRNVDRILRHHALPAISDVGVREHVVQLLMDRVRTMRSDVEKLVEDLPRVPKLLLAIASGRYDSTFGRVPPLSPGPDSEHGTFNMSGVDPATGNDEYPRQPGRRRLVAAYNLGDAEWREARLTHPLWQRARTRRQVAAYTDGSTTQTLSPDYDEHPFGALYKDEDDEVEQADDTELDLTTASPFVFNPPCLQGCPPYVAERGAQPVVYYMVQKVLWGRDRGVAWITPGSRGYVSASDLYEHLHRALPDVVPRGRADRFQLSIGGRQILHRDWVMKQEFGPVTVMPLI